MVVDMKTQDDIQPEYEQVSALMDGCLSGVELDSALQYAASGEGLECWHLYHVIGDTLRSPELAACQHDSVFVARLSERLRTEAAQPSVSETVAMGIPLPEGARADRPAANDSVFRWKFVAGLASFAAVAAIGWSALGGSGSLPAGPQMAQGTLAPAPALALVDSRVETRVPAAALPPAAESEAPVMLRDPLLDELLAAHRQASGASALGDASGFLRNATFEGTGR